MNLKFSVLKTLLLLLPRFPTFMKAHDLILSDETSRAADVKRSNETVLLAAGVAASKTETSVPTQPPTDRAATTANYTNFNSGDRGHDRGRGGSHGRDDLNGGRGGGRHNNNSGNASQWANSIPWSSPWGPAWCTPWTGAMGPGVLGTHPPLVPPQAYQAFQPMMMPAPVQTLSWDTSGLVQALQAASLQQASNPGDWT
jgi:hypothetical protein